LALDVFRSNTSAVGWYDKLGFGEELQTNVARVKLKDLDVHDAPVLRFSEENLASALSDEKYWGFSRLECTHGDRTLTVGVIGGHTCKLLNYDGVSLEEAIVAVAATFRRARTFLIFSFSGHTPPGTQSATCERVLRLSRALR
jgi:hypothetical protein